MNEPLEQWIYPMASDFMSYADAYYFQVPRDRERIRVRFKVFWKSVKPEVTLFDSKGRRVESKTMEPVHGKSQPWTVWDAAAPPETRGGLWKLQVRPLSANVEEVKVRVDGVPPVVSVTPRAFFVPEPMPAVRFPEPRDRPEGVAGPVRTIPAGKEHRISRGPRSGEGRYERVHLRQGTIEFWMRPDWPRDDLMSYETTAGVVSAKDFLRFGKLQARRTRFGVRAALHEGVLMTNFFLASGVWRHIAVTWDLDTEARARRFAFHVDGVPMGRLWKDVPGEGFDWTGEALRLRATTGPIRIAGLRISAKSRFDDLKQGVLSPPPDEHTLYYDAGD
jgi:hypothetical protein